MIITDFERIYKNTTLESKQNNFRKQTKQLWKANNRISYNFRLYIDG